MKIASASLITILIAASPATAEDQTPLSDDTAKINYSVGYQIGSDFKYQNIEIRSDAILQGIRDAMKGNEGQMTNAQMRQVMADLGKRLAEQKRKKKEALLREQSQKRKNFHTENGKKTGIVTTESGLQYRILEAGRGKRPLSTDKVLVHYTGKLIDGTEFDSSYGRGKPASFQVNRVIKGWTEALQLMKQGARWQLFIPSDLAYGEKGAPPRIPPHSSLIFDVDLLAIE
ncbi:MAG: FKBP-type peptidyl-prolyl cis-trans isomerase [Candidatus Thiodiazotropha sp. (ex Monitilora ramsayi)]|nr:FKBP-type peptidyl-prolyl cis-trans isomerase [Candidatus Thiodiazotropha sp. (ex Monitilora ramsayi)]